MSDAKPNIVHVIAPARLHLGFIDLNGSLGRRFGSIGLSINAPFTELKIKRTQKNSVLGKDSERALKILQTTEVHHADNQAYQIEIKEAIPAHAGLGSGTQLAFAIRAGILRLSKKENTFKTLPQETDRGERSGIGMTSFREGGFIVDGGRGNTDKAPPTIVRLAFPESWRIILVLDPKRLGVHGEIEKNAFRTLPPYSETTAGHLSRLTLMKLLPSIVEHDLVNFGLGLSEIQSIVGEYFSPVQGGTPWSSPAVGKIIKKIGELGGTGLGQSSWGPTGFAFVSNDAEAEHLYSSVKEEAKSLDLELKIVKGRNSGATVEFQ